MSYEGNHLALMDTTTQTQAASSSATPTPSVITPATSATNPATGGTPPAVSQPAPSAQTQAIQSTQGTQPTTATQPTATATQGNDRPGDLKAFFTRRTNLFSRGKAEAPTQATTSPVQPSTSPTQATQAPSGTTGLATPEPGVSVSPTTEAQLGAEATATDQADPLALTEAEKAEVAEQPLHLQPRWQAQIQARKQAEAKLAAIQAEQESYATRLAEAERAREEALAQASLAAEQARQAAQREAEYTQTEAEQVAAQERAYEQYLANYEAQVRAHLVEQSGLDPEFLTDTEQALLDRAVAGELEKAKGYVEQDRAAKEAERVRVRELTLNADTYASQAQGAVHAAIANHPLASVSVEIGEGESVGFADLAAIIADNATRSALQQGQDVGAVTQQVAVMFQGLLEGMAVKAQEAARAQALAEFEAQKPALEQAAVQAYLAGKTGQQSLLGVPPTGSSPALGSAPVRTDKYTLSGTPRLFSR